jgi:uncharacterized membrane protein affecting hemolysin expression
MNFVRSTVSGLLLLLLLLLMVVLVVLVRRRLHPLLLQARTSKQQLNHLLKVAQSMLWETKC